MAAIRVVLLTFGDAEANHWQAWYALLTTMANGGVAAEYVVVTDRPLFYRWFGDRVRTLAVDGNQLERWKGRHGFFWRVKIEAVRAAAALPAQRDPGSVHTVYIDSDIICRQPLADFRDALDRGDVFMHLRESTFATLRRRSHRTLRDQLLGRTWAGVPVDGDTAMWNAGVVAVGTGQGALLDRALALCDAVIADGPCHHLAEQFAFSAALATSGRLRAASPWFDHYWGNKPGYQEAICARLATVLVRGLDVDDAIALVRAQPIDRPLAVRRRWWNRLFAPLAGQAD